MFAPGSKVYLDSDLNLCIYINPPLFGRVGSGPLPSVKVLINSYQLTTEEAEDFAERGNYSYVLSGNLASEHYFQKKKATLRAG